MLQQPHVAGQGQILTDELTHVPLPSVSVCSFRKCMGAPRLAPQFHYSSSKFSLRAYPP